MLCPATEEAIRAFQRARGLFVTGECDEHTWHALVEASWQLGDRNLQLTSPFMRGDDVATMQISLGRLGFDCGRIDGIFGPITVRAVSAFQAQAGLVSDGVCGPVTVSVLSLLTARTGDGPGVAMLRELEEQRTRGEQVAGTRLAVGQLGALGPLVGGIGRGLRARGAHVVVLDQPDALAQADAANRFGASAYLVFEPADSPSVELHYYSVPAFESVRGRALAGLLAEQFRARLDLAPVIHGMRLPVLRETKMPAVHVLISSSSVVLDHLTELAGASISAVEQWISGRAS